MKVLVTGDRNWTNNDTITGVLRGVLDEARRRGEQLEVVHGDARGADRIAGQIAARLGARVHVHPADWAAYGKAAGPIRNREMLAEHPDIERVLAFHADITHSKGTRDMVEEAHRRNLPVFLFPNQQDLAKLQARRKQQALF